MSTIEWKGISIKELAALVSRTLNAQGIEAILVGGACVAIYSRNKYVSKDLDLITYAPMAAVADALSALGFEAKSRRHFVRKDCPFYLEFVAPPVTIGDEPIEKFNELRTAVGKIKMLTPTDCIKDRLAAYFYWNDPQSFQQAILVARKHKVDWKNLLTWVKKEKQLEKYKEFIMRMKPNKKS